MPNLTKFFQKALKKSAQKEGLFRQVERKASSLNEDASIAARDALQIAQDPMYRGNERGIINELRHARNFESSSSPLFQKRADLENYPTSNLDLNARIRGDLEWAAGKERSKGIPDYYEDETVAPSRRMYEGDFQKLKSLDPEERAAYMEDYDFRDRKLYTEDLNDKWNQIKSLLKDKKSSK